MNRISTFLQEVRVELTKVSWPTREQMVQYTLTVITITLVTAVFLGLVDFGLTYLLNKFILQ